MSDEQRSEAGCPARNMSVNFGSGTPERQRLDPRSVPAGRVGGWTFTLIVAAILAYWSGSPIRPDFSTYIMITAVFMVVAMWIFPEAGVKKGDKSKAR